MADIRVYHTHIEVFPYSLGDCPQIEWKLSKKDPVTKQSEKIGFFVDNNVLYLPRGINGSLLERYFNSMPIVDYKYDEYERIKKGEILVEPKSRMQDEAIQFLCAQNVFSYSGRYSQIGLNLPTGDGKTLATVNAILHYKMKTIIIMHKRKLKEEWYNEFRTKTDFPLNQIIDIEGSDTIQAIMNGKIEGEVYLVLHQTLNSYARENSWLDVRKFFQKIKVGIKVFDEAHLFFRNCLMIDFFSNTYKTFYLTATFGRSDNKELEIYKSAYSSMVRFGEEVNNYKEKRHHTNVMIVFFHSHPDTGYANVRTAYGFSSYKYIDYELSEENHSLFKVLKHVLSLTERLEGRIAITSPKVESVIRVADYVKDLTGKDVGVLHSKLPEELLSENYKKEVISATVKMIGEGDNIKGLRILINLCPLGSKDNLEQLIGRLREYSDDKETYVFYPIDLSVPDCYEFYKRALPMLKKKCKSVVKYEINV